MSWGRRVIVKVQKVPSDFAGNRRQKGFALVKSLTSIIMLAFFLLSACHLLLNLLSSKLLDQTTQKLIDSFQKARQAAIETNSHVQVTPKDNNWGNGWLVAIPAGISGSELLDGQQVLHTEEQLVPSIQFSNTGKQAVIFKPNGMTTNLNPLGENGIVFCNAKGKGRKLTMLATGFIQVSDIKQCGVS